MFGIRIETGSAPYEVWSTRGLLLYVQPKKERIRDYVSGGSSFGLEWMVDYGRLGIWHPTDNYGSGGLFPVDADPYPSIGEHFVDDVEVEEEARNFRTALARGEYDDWPELTGEAV